jgi:Flp pilus assembly protein TadG
MNMPTPILAIGRRRRGQMLLELAIILPLLVTMLLGMLEFGWYFYYLAAVNNAVRTGARTGAAANLTTNNDAAVTAAVTACLGHHASGVAIDIWEFSSTTINSYSPALPPASAKVINPTREKGNFIVVKASIPYNTLTKLVNLQTLAGITSINDYATFLIHPSN